MTAAGGDPTHVEGVPDRASAALRVAAGADGSGHAVGINAQSGAPSGTESERDAPGSETGKRGDDVE